MDKAIALGLVKLQRLPVPVTPTSASTTPIPTTNTPPCFWFDFIEWMEGNVCAQIRPILRWISNFVIIFFCTSMLNMSISHPSNPPPNTYYFPSAFIHWYFMLILFLRIFHLSIPIPPSIPAHSQSLKYSTPFYFNWSMRSNYILFLSIYIDNFAYVFINYFYAGNLQFSLSKIQPNFSVIFTPLYVIIFCIIFNIIYVFCNFLRLYDLWWILK